MHQPDTHPLILGVLSVNSMWITGTMAKSEAKSPRPLRGLQVDFSLTHNVSYAVR